MRVKVGSTVYDAEDQPIMIICTAEEREQMNNMPATNKKYCQFPGGMDPDDIRTWMREGVEDEASGTEVLITDVPVSKEPPLLDLDTDVTIMNDAGVHSSVCACGECKDRRLEREG